MKQCSPHRKRRANKGRVDTGVVVTSNYRKVEGTQRALVWDADVCKPHAAAGRHKEVDAILDERTFHRNRFIADHRICMTAPDVYNVRKCLKNLRFILGEEALSVESVDNGMLSIKVNGRVPEVLKIIQNSKASRLIVLQANVFCGENRSPVANTMRKLHGRSY